MRLLQCLALLVACHSLCACELVADFDRGKLDAGKPADAGQPPMVPETDDAGDADADAAK